MGLFYKFVISTCYFRWFNYQIDAKYTQIDLSKCSLPTCLLPHSFISHTVSSCSPILISPTRGANKSVQDRFLLFLIEIINHLGDHLELIKACEFSEASCVQSLEFLSHCLSPPHVLYAYGKWPLLMQRQHCRLLEENVQWVDITVDFL